jgi:hypothetical protein
MRTGKKFMMLRIYQAARLFYVFYIDRFRSETKLKILTLDDISMLRLAYDAHGPNLESGSYSRYVNMTVSDHDETSEAPKIAPRMNNVIYMRVDHTSE